nr:MAG TPA: hypothetical protein [Caudoviricetes sp.]
MSFFLCKVFQISAVKAGQLWVYMVYTIYD